MQTTLSSEPTPAQIPPERSGAQRGSLIGSIFALVGRGIIGFFAELGRIVMLLGNVFRYVPTALRSRRLVLEQMAVIGVSSLPLVLLVGSFTGAIAALQATNLFAKFNLLALARPFVGGSIATVVFTELSPVLTALVIAGRVGGSIAAQIGTMKVSEQIDALEMMAVHPDRYLAMPRVIAAMTMMPVLIIFSNLVALLGAFLLVILKFNFSSIDYFESIRRYFSISEILTGMLKSLTFGGVTALIGCYIGFRTEGGAEGVGRSTVRAFTLSSAAILVLDAIFGYVL
jgi:phospholipid/cholesterol/gamma-HCH transport system permease protein